MLKEKKIRKVVNNSKLEYKRAGQIKKRDNNNIITIQMIK